MVPNLRLVDDVMNVMAGQPDHAMWEQMRSQDDPDDGAPPPPPPCRNAPPHRPPQVVMVAITTAVTRAILTPLYAIACMVQLRQVLQEPVVAVQMGVLWGMVAEGIWVGIWAFG